MADALYPESWDEYIGQNKLKERLKIRIKAARENWRMLPHMLLAGPPGTGKTSLATLIAKEMGMYFNSYVMPIGGDKLREVVTWEGGIILLDEAHRIKVSDQEDLLPALQGGYFQRPWGKEPIEQEITVVLATTEINKVIPALRDRLVIPPFEPYSEEEMGLIITSMGRKVGLDFEPECARMLGKASAGSPRQARHLVEAARDLPDPYDVAAVLDLAGLSSEGLTHAHIEYLKALKATSSGAAGVKVLAAATRLPEQEVINLETTLRNLNFIEYTPKGRALRMQGYKFLNQTKESI